MKALSLRQPWAWLVIHGGKRIENRTWPTSFRGRFFIHAAKGCTASEYSDALAFCRSKGISVVGMPTHDRLLRGGIVGAATLTGVMRPGMADHRPALSDYPTLDLRWHMLEQHGFVLEGVSEVPFIPMRGMLGFFDVKVEELATP